jgi:hypothetical protein
MIFAMPMPPIMLAADVHPKVASERLGHSRIGITLDLYSHVLLGMQEDAGTKSKTSFSDRRRYSFVIDASMKAADDVPS